MGSERSWSSAWLTYSSTFLSPSAVTTIATTIGMCVNVKAFRPEPGARLARLGGEGPLADESR